jgi:hypothetical protein
MRSATAIATLIALLGAASRAFAADPTPAEAFALGTSFGQANNGGNAANITSGNASAQVPNYTPSNSASSYYNNGQGSLNGPASGDVTTCTNTSTDPDDYTHGKCESVRMLMHNPGAAQAAFPINRTTDPLMTTRNTVKSDPSTYLGGLSPQGAYSGCTQQTVTSPPTYTTETCVQALGVSPQTCHKTLSVVVNTIQLCQPGTYEFPFRFDTHDVGGEWWITDSMCAGGTIRVQCASGGYQASTFHIPLNASNTTPIQGTTCYPHTHYGGMYRIFYYVNPHCDAAANLCTVTMYDVPAWSPTINTCPAGYNWGPVGMSYDPSTFTCVGEPYQGVDPITGDSVMITPTSPPISTAPNIQHTWTQTYRMISDGYTYTDNWDDQCASMAARVVP